MIRYYNDEGELNDPSDWKKNEEAIKLLQKSYKAFKEAGYHFRDFYQFVDLEGSLMEGDDVLEMLWKLEERDKEKHK